MTLAERYRAKKFSELKGKGEEIEQVKIFMKNFPKKKALILHGGAGTGKTSLAYALANETNSEIIELNASDLRNKDEISKIVGEATKQKSLFADRKIILIDEVDGITREDRGGLPELIRLIRETNFPIIITSNDIWNRKFSSLRRTAQLIQLKPLNHNLIYQLIREISEKENLNINSDMLINLAIKSGGDARAAINDLQTVHPETNHEDIHERDKEADIFNTLKQVFQQLPTKDTVWLYDKVNMNLDEILLWIEENTPKEYKGEELYKAFEAISKADVFRGRIYRQQHWRFLLYQNFLLSVGVSAAKKQVKTGFTSYKKPERILKIWLINQRYKYKKTIAEKYAKYCHINKKRAMKDFPIIKNILKNQNIQQELRLDEKEIEFLGR